MCYNGFGMPKDTKKAFQLFLKAAEMGNSTAQGNTGVAYVFGEAVKQDYGKAFTVVP